MKRLGILQIGLLCAGPLLSCAADHDSAPESHIAPQSETALSEPLVVNIGCIPEFAHTADTMEELCADSDVIVEGVVTVSEGALFRSSDIVYTRLQIEPLTVYKGEYHGETLQSHGGIMNLGAYCAALGKTVLPYTTQELQTGIVHYEWVNNFAPQVGDHILFFGQYDALDPNAIWNTNTTQGLYCCDDETIYTTALHINENGWTEPLAEDMIARCEGTVTAPLRSETASPALSVERDVFLEILGSSSNT